MSTNTRIPARAEHARDAVRHQPAPAREPRRIVSLSPAATEILCALGIGARLVGVSEACDHPRAVVGLPVVRRARSARVQLDWEALAQLTPDLVLAEEPLPEDLGRDPRFAEASWLELRPRTLEEVLADVIRIGTAAWAEGRGDELARAMDRRLARLERESIRLRRPRVLVLERLEPAAAAGGWIPDLVRAAGGDPLRPDPTRPLERGGAEILVVAQPGLGVQRSLEDLDAGLGERLVRGARNVVVVDGQSFLHRPGPRLVESAEILALALHPRRFLGRFGFGRETLGRWRG